ncbi:MAG TPA: DNA replication complex GINS family protein, partial [Methanocorpusculum sp.]|nr:DNA replication complex GINS family protein [Methanocorpusculum sp.]HJJ52959.1 DNA replication complex GINS family protein [Methanocorpusculum sp.]
MGRISTSDLHGYLIDDRNLGSLAEIPATLYEEIHGDIMALSKQASAHDDPFGEGVQSLLKERESLREYIRDLYAIRTRKILALALARANGEEINRDEIRMMVPGE